MAELVAIGVPVYRGTAFVAETLRSIQAQTYRDIDVLISVDGGDEESANCCKPFLDDSRFKMVLQDRQLGWAENISFLMARNSGQFWYYHQQDDLVTPDYIETLLHHARGNPAAAVVYCDIQAFGGISNLMHQMPVTGPPLLREISLLTSHHPAVAFRGLTRRDALEQAAGVRSNEIECFSADTTWMASVARAGELHRVPRALYFKRYHADNVHTKWAAWPVDKRRRAWQIHCRDIVIEAIPAGETVLERRLIWAAGVARLILPITNYPQFASSTPERAQAIDGFLGDFGEHAAFVEAQLESDWQAISKAARELLAGC
jgi:GT2 family glycosyltransferase